MAKEGEQLMSDIRKRITPIWHYGGAYKAVCGAENRKGPEYTVILTDLNGNPDPTTFSDFTDRVTSSTANITCDACRKHPAFKTMVMAIKLRTEACK